MPEVPIKRKMTASEIESAYQEYSELIETNTKKAAISMLEHKYPVSGRTLYRYFNKIDREGKVNLKKTATRKRTVYDYSDIKRAYREHSEGTSLSSLADKYDIPSSTLSRHFIKIRNSES